MAAPNVIKKKKEHVKIINQLIEGEERPVAQGRQLVTPAVGFWVHKRRGVGSQRIPSPAVTRFRLSFTSIAIFVYSL